MLVPLTVRVAKQHVREVRVGVADDPVSPVDRPAGVGVRDVQHPYQYPDGEVGADLLDEVELALAQRSAAPTVLSVRPRGKSSLLDPVRSQYKEAFVVEPHRSSNRTECSARP
jgi:hypothetical protein